MMRVKLPHGWIDALKDHPLSIRGSTPITDDRGLMLSKVAIVDQFEATLVIETVYKPLFFNTRYGNVSGNDSVQIPHHTGYLDFEHDDEAVLFKLTYL